MHLMNYQILSVLLFTAVATASAAKVYVDLPQMNSVLLENFSAEADPASELRNGVRFLSASEGVARYSIANVLDPQLFFDGYVGGVDFSSYPNVRIRHSFTTSARDSSVYPIPVRTGQMGKLSINNALVGRQVTLEEHPAFGEGIRVDPVDGPPVAGEYWIDYIIVDRGRTLGFEFDQKDSTRGGINNFFIGTNLGGVNGKEILTGVDDGVYRGNPTSPDPIMVLQMSTSTGLQSINSDVYKFIEIRMRVLEPRQGIATIFFRSQSGDMSANQIDFELVNDEFFHTYLIDLRNDMEWNQGMITGFRFDPTNQKQAFEIDHIRFYETAVIE